MAEDLSALNRSDLNARAEEAGVDDPASFASKADLIEAISEAEDAEESDESEEAEDGEEEDVVHTSDPEARVEGVENVQPDPSTETHASDAPDYPFPPGGDIDTGKLSDEELEGETPAPLQPDSRVILADTDAVPEELQGHPALVTNVSVEEDEDGEEQQVFTVKTRDEHDATLVGLTRDDFSEVFAGGVGVRGFGP